MSYPKSEESKPFKTYRQQLKILRSRGLDTGNGSKAIQILEQVNYYSLINGYKDLFLRKDSNGEPLTPEEYIQHSSLNEIYQLYCLDRDLRALLLKELLKFEENMKTKLSYRFSMRHKEANAYLNIKNYSDAIKRRNDILDLIAAISRTISRSKKEPPIEHYLKEYGAIPLWVLVKYLTFGDIESFYKCLPEVLRKEISDDFTSDYRRQYHGSAGIDSDMIAQILIVARRFRNVCAHEGRMYNLKLNKNELQIEKNFSSVLKIPLDLLSTGGGLYMHSFFENRPSKERIQINGRELKEHI